MIIFFHSFDGIADEFEVDEENDFSAAMAESAGGGGRKRVAKAAVDIHQSLVVGGRTDGDPVLEFIIAHVGTTEVPVVKADKNKAFSVQELVGAQTSCSHIILVPWCGPQKRMCSDLFASRAASTSTKLWWSVEELKRMQWRKCGRETKGQG